MERMKCPECGHDNPMTGVTNEARQYVCRQCGMVYYTPDDCLTTSEDEGPPDQTPRTAAPEDLRHDEEEAR